jgi:hypothetical protein
MGVSYTTKKNLIPQMMKKAQAINGKKVEVGVFDGDHAWLAGIHEYGCTITPKNGKYLTVPLTAAAASNKARNFVGTFVYTSKSGNKFIAWERGGKLELLFWLTDSVTIPERSFLRSGFDACHEKVIGNFEKVLPNYLISRQHVETVLKMCGKQLASQIKKYARDLKEPPKNKITSASYGGKKNNPLIKTGEMIQSITYRIEDE